MNLGLMAVAANAGMKADRDQQVFDYEQKRRESEMSLLDDKTAAERGVYRLRTGLSQQGLDLLPGDTENKKTAQRTAGINANIDLSNAEDERANQPTALKIKDNNRQADLMRSNADLADLPKKLQQASLQGLISEEAQRSVVRGTIGQLLINGDKEGALRFGRQVSLMPNVLTSTNGKPLADFKTVRKGESMGNDKGGKPIPAPDNGVLFITEDGQAHFNPASAMTADMQRMKSGDYAHVVSNDGTIGMYDKKAGPGTFKTVHQGNPKVNAMADRRPREVQLFEFYKGLGYDQNAALSKVKELGSKPRQQFEADSLKDALTMAPGNTPEEKAANAYALVRKAADLVYGGGQQAPTGPSNARAPQSVIDPQIRSLLGMPGDTAAPAQLSGAQADPQAQSQAPAWADRFAAWWSRPARRQAPPETTPGLDRASAFDEKDATDEGQLALTEQSDQIKKGLVQAQSDYRSATSLAGRRSVTPEQAEAIRVAIEKLSRQQEEVDGRLLAGRRAALKARGDAAYNASREMQSSRAAELQRRVGLYTLDQPSQ